MPKGTVVRFDDVRGYGFITPDAGGEDVFVHINDLGGDRTYVAAGTPVEFEVTEGERGLKAFAVRALREPAEQRAEPVAGSASVAGRETDDGAEPLSDVLSETEFTHELSELFLRTMPELTGEQIVKLRRSLVAVAIAHGWVET